MDKINAINALLGGVGTVRPYMDRFHNLYVRIPGRTHGGPVLAITAHHDVVNRESENCLDNTASVLNLVRLYFKLLDNSPERDVILAWVDAEEMCNSAVAGATQLLRDHQVDLLLDLELTAGGSHPVICRYGDFDLFPGMLECGMPLNNAHLVDTRGDLEPAIRVRGSACLTLVSDSDLLELSSRGHCSRWSQCHRLTDTFERWFSVVESEALLNLIVSTIS